MCKKDQLLEYSIQDIIDMITTDQSIEYDEAMNKFYNSEVFEKLIDKETGVNYLVWMSGYAGGITQLLDSDGNLVITK